MDSFIITLPQVKAVSFSQNPVVAEGRTVLSVTVEEITKTVYPEQRYAGEFYCGE